MGSRAYFEEAHFFLILVFFCISMNHLLRTAVLLRFTLHMMSLSVPKCISAICSCFPLYLLHSPELI